MDRPSVVVVWVRLDLPTALEPRSVRSAQTLGANHLVLRSFDASGNRDARIRRSMTGRPFLEGVSLSVSVAHRDGIVAVAFSDSPVGIDVVDVRLDHGALPERFLPSQELQVLSSATPGSRAEAFWRLWGAKEARLKALGEGQLFPLRETLPDDPSCRTGFVSPGLTWRTEELTSRYQAVVVGWAGPVRVFESGPGIKGDDEADEALSALCSPPVAR